MIPSKTRTKPKTTEGFWGKTPREWERLLKRYELVPLTELREWEHNPRINDDAVPKLMELIREHGFAGAIVATPDGVIRAGHTRYKAVKELGHKKIWVHWKNFSSEKAADAFALADNKSNEWADWDHKKLAELFKKRLTVDMQRITGFDRSQIDWGGLPPADLTKVKVMEDEAEDIFTIRIEVRRVHTKRLVVRLQKSLDKFNARVFPNDPESAYKILVF